VSKRRISSTEDERAPEDLTPEERREQRRREKAQAKSGKHRQGGFGSPLRRGLLLGIPTAVVVVVVLLVFFNPFNIPSPCLTLSQPTAPYYPAGGTTNFGQSWCPQGNPTIAFAIQPKLLVVVNGTSVGLPPGIGVNRSYGSYTCTLPVSTPTTPGVLPAGVFLISSPWSYQYSLNWFFEDWQLTFHTVAVGKAPSQPIIYTSSDLLGFTASPTHAITLFVDGHLSTAGPGLGLSTLDYSPGPFPSCITNDYGTGHTIVLTYGSSNPGAGVHGVVAPTLRTSTLLSDWELQGWYGPAPHFGLLAQLYGSAHDRGISSFSFAIGRGIPG
jgi:hypothetical protein